MRRHLSFARRLLALACVAVAVAPIAAPPAADAGVPTGAPAALGGWLRAPQDDPTRSWAVRPAGPDGKPDARTHFTLQSVPGGTLKDQALVTNLGKTATTFVVYAADAFNTPDGQFELLGAGQPNADIGKWIVFGASGVTIPAGGSVVVPFVVQVPANASPGDHAGGVLVSLITPSVQAGKQVNLETRVGVRVYLRVPGNLQPKLTVGPVNLKYHGTVNPLGDGSLDVTYTVDNPGNIRLQSHPGIKVTGPFGDTVATLTPKDLPEILPRGHVTYTARVPGVFPEGPLTASVTLKPFTDPLQPVGQVLPSVSGDGYIWAVPWMLLLLVLIVLLLIALAWWLLRRRLLRRLDRAMRVARESALAESAGAGGGAGRSKGAGGRSKVGASGGRRGGRG
jgi:hypothetical protein